MNRPKAKGTALETAVTRYATDYGLNARRVVLHGNADQGDVHIHDGTGSLFVIECKNTPNRLDIPGALRELDREKENAGAMFGCVVFKAKGTTDVGDYYAVQRFRDYLGGLVVPF